MLKVWRLFVICACSVFKRKAKVETLYKASNYFVEREISSISIDCSPAHISTVSQFNHTRYHQVLRNFVYLPFVSFEERLNDGMYCNNNKPVTICLYN